MKSDRTKLWNTRHHRRLRTDTMPSLPKTCVQMTSWSRNNTFTFLEFWNIRPKTRNRKNLTLQGFLKRRNPFFEKLFEKRVSFTFFGGKLWTGAWTFVPTKIDTDALSPILWGSKVDPRKLNLLLCMINSLFVVFNIRNAPCISSWIIAFILISNNFWIMVTAEILSNEEGEIARRR